MEYGFWWRVVRVLVRSGFRLGGFGSIVKGDAPGRFW